MEKPLAMLFVDIADSTPLYERIGNLRAAELTRKMLLHLRLVIEINGGMVVKTTGDGLLGAFPDADDAAWAAITMMDSQPVFDLRLRIGLNHGMVVQRVEDLYGDACNVAARVEALARPGEILATEDLARLLSPPLAARTRLLNTIVVKGRSVPVRVHQIHPEPIADEAVATTTVGMTISFTDLGHGGLLMLHLVHAGRTVTLNRFNPRVTIGRDETCQLHIPSRRTSRQHAVIDFSRESFILTDHSTNGTFVRSTSAGGRGASAPLTLRRDATKLVGGGLIGFGAEPLEEGQDHVVAFRCERA